MTKTTERKSLCINFFPGHKSAYHTFSKANVVARLKKFETNHSDGGMFAFSSYGYVTLGEYYDK